MKYLILSTVSIAAVFSISGCASRFQKEDHVAPSAGNATLQLGTMPKKIVADFYLNETAESCRNFKDSGYVYDWDTANSGNLENLARKLNFAARDEVKSIETPIPSGRPIQVAGWNSEYGPKCGPVFAQFEPIKAHKYQAYFVMWEKHCRMEVVDTTDPGKQVLANGFKPIQCKAMVKAAMP